MTPLYHPCAQQVPEADLEKNGELELQGVRLEAKQEQAIANRPLSPKIKARDDVPRTPVIFTGKLARLNDKIEGLSGLEARGIVRVLPEERHGCGRKGYFQMFLL